MELGNGILPRFGAVFRQPETHIGIKLTLS